MAIAFGALLGPSAFAATSPGTTVAFTTNVTVPAGALLVVGMSWYNAAVTTVTVAGGGLTWTVDIATNPAGGNHRAGIASAPAPSGLASGTTITATFSNSSFTRTICGLYFTGTDLTGTREDVDGSANGAPAGQTNVSLTTAGAAALVSYAWADNAPGATHTPVAGATEAFDFDDTHDNEHPAMTYRVETTAGTYVVGGKFNGGSVWVGVGTSYKAPSVFVPSDPDTFVRASGAWVAVDRAARAGGAWV